MVPPPAQLYDHLDPLILASCPPISRIPDEILSHILVLGQVPLSIHPFWPIETDQVESPAFEVLVSQVDQRWRYVALNTLSLWRRIDIVPTRTVTEIQTYLDRSKTCPTDVRLDQWSWKSSVPHTLTNLVMHTTKGWRQAVINISFDNHYHPFLKHLENFPIPNAPLEHLSLCVEKVDYCHSYPKFQSELVQILKLGAPQLKFVRLRGMAPHYFRPPMTAVTTLHLELTKAISMNYSTMKAILTASPSLTNLSLYGEPIHFVTWPAQAPQGMKLPELKSLRLWGTQGWIFNVVLSHISAPRVHSLYLKEARENDLNAFWASSHRNFPILRSLVFYHCDFSEASYQTVCEAFPHITDFTAYTTFYETPIIVELLGNRESAPIWPKLHTLRVLLDTSEEQKSLYDMVVTRADMKIPLSKLGIGTRRPLDVLVGMSEVQKYVEVETFAELDQWPEGLVYPDDDDDIF